GPREFFFARPDQLDRLPYRTSQVRGLDCHLAGVFAAVGRPGIRYDHPDVLFGHTERRRKLATYAERTLCPGPDRQTLAMPLGDRRAGLQRRMGDIGHGIGLAERAVRN